MNSFLSMVISTIKYRFSAITSRLRYWTNASYVRTRVFAAIRQWFNGLFRIKPRDKDDYYTIGRIMVSRRLAHVVIIAVGLVCIAYLAAAKPFADMADAANGETDIKVYAYNSIPLRFKNGTVSITAKKGYIAYTGQVKGGYAQGSGTLYNESGVVIYEGEFSKNKYNGTGIEYYDNGQKKYSGEFADNIYEGTGSLYRQNGVILYDGAFSSGYQNGTGRLYNGAGNQIFEGEFSKGELVYTQLLDKTSQEIAEMYSGTQTLYSYNDENVIALNDLSVLYVPSDSQTSVSSETRSKTLYIVNDTCVIGAERVNTISGLKKLLGEPQYEGNSYLEYADAVAINIAKNSGADTGIDEQLKYSMTYDELAEVSSYSRDAMLYLYTYETDGLVYTFITSGNDDTFFMYTISE